MEKHFSIVIFTLSFGLAFSDPIPQELLAKFDFEDGRMEAWTLEQKSSNQTISASMDETVSHSGKYSFRIERKEAGPWRHYYAGVRLRSPGTFTEARGSAFVKGRNIPPGSVVLSVLEYDKGKVLGWMESKTQIAAFSPGENWTQTSFSGKVSPTATEFTVYVRLSPSVPAGAVFWIDDLDIEGVVTP